MNVRIPYPERAWPVTWEQNPVIDTCMHSWETVERETRPGHWESLDRCRHCVAPRCDRLDDIGTRCVERRHHRTVHIFPSGLFEPVGGYLQPEGDA